VIRRGVLVKASERSLYWLMVQDDRTLAGSCSRFSRSYLQQLIEAQAVQLNGVVANKSSAKVKPVCFWSSS
jgi:hypothetical protein